MNCPYAERTCIADLAPAAERCPACKRFSKRCPQCHLRSRAFANFCRGCGAALPVRQGNWLGFKGGARRAGVNSRAEGPRRQSVDIVSAGLKLRLGGVCRSLLGYDGQLIAVARDGTIEIGDPARPAGATRLQARGPVSCEPCIERGLLFLGAPNQLSAYSLGAITLPVPRLRPLWQIALDGTPIQALTAVGNRLYAAVASDVGRSLQVIENVVETPPSAPRTLYATRGAASRLSWLAADDVRAVFLTEEEGSVELHSVTHARLELSSRTVMVPAFAEHPISLLGEHLFGVFGNGQQLYRINVRAGSVDEQLDDDTQLFSLTHDGDHEWDRDGVRIDSSGVAFMRAAGRDTFNDLDRAVKGSPVIVEGRVAAIGMQDGRVLIYDLQHPPKHEKWRLGGNGAAITALASFGHYVAAGDADGIVEVVELRERAGTP
ncbi:MAG TPA: zinc ribbon domain-containing protein [Thermoanaerobaculia bacterium]